MIVFRLCVGVCQIFHGAAGQRSDIPDYSVLYDWSAQEVSHQDHMCVDHIIVSCHVVFSMWMWMCMLNVSA